MFEVGKEYKCTTGLRAMCVGTFSDERYHFMLGLVTNSAGSFSKGNVEKFSMSHGGKNWAEYVKPKVEKIRRNVCKEDNGFYSYRSSGYSYYGTIELTIIDGKLTNVEIVE